MSDSSIFIPKHPAKYSDVLMPVMARMIGNKSIILDPFAGVGKIYNLANYIFHLIEIQAVEIEPEWAYQDERITLGSALNLPWCDGYFDAVVTSPTYGNRMADKWSSCTTKPIGKYAWELHRELHPDNSGSLNWGEPYRNFHRKAYLEISRVLMPGGLFILNMKDHIRKGQRMFVTEWHISCLMSLNYSIVEHEKVGVKGFVYGENRDSRIEYESVISFIYNG